VPLRSPVVGAAPVMEANSEAVQTEVEIPTVDGSSKSYKPRIPFIRRNDGEMELGDPETAGLGDCDSTLEDADQIPILMSDYFKTFKQVTESNGFAYECHTVQTDDGYILNMFRV
jgi:hypothetical protein